MRLYLALRASRGLLDCLAAPQELRRMYCHCQICKLDHCRVVVKARKCEKLFAISSVAMSHSKAADGFRASLACAATVTAVCVPCPKEMDCGRGMCGM